VSWYDDHPEFTIPALGDMRRPFKVPHIEDIELRFWADEHCNAETDYVRCDECAGYNRKGASKCRECGKTIQVACARCGKRIAEADSWGDGDVGDDSLPSFCSKTCYEAGPTSVEPCRTPS
jgi:hypothetical protein